MSYCEFEAEFFSKKLSLSFTHPCVHTRTHTHPYLHAHARKLLCTTHTRTRAHVHTHTRTRTHDKCCNKHQISVSFKVLRKSPFLLVNINQLWPEASADKNLVGKDLVAGHVSLELFSRLWPNLLRQLTSTCVIVVHVANAIHFLLVCTYESVKTGQVSIYLWPQV